jgi:hypothetical protein
VSCHFAQGARVASPAILLEVALAVVPEVECEATLEGGGGRGSPASTQGALVSMMVWCGGKGGEEGVGWEATQVHGKREPKTRC